MQTTVDKGFAAAATGFAAACDGFNAVVATTKDMFGAPATPNIKPKPKQQRNKKRKCLTLQGEENAARRRMHAKTAKGSDITNTTDVKTASNVFVAESVRGLLHVGTRKYAILAWENYTETENTVEPVSNLLCPKLLQEYSGAKGFSWEFDNAGTWTPCNSDTTVKLETEFETWSRRLESKTAATVQPDASLQSDIKKPKRVPPAKLKDLTPHTFTYTVTLPNQHPGRAPFTENYEATFVATPAPSFTQKNVRTGVQRLLRRVSMRS